MVVEFNAEHHITDSHDINLAEQLPRSIEHRKHRRVTPADFMNNLPEFHIGCDTQIIPLDDRIKIHQRQHGMVGVMCQQLALTSQPGAVNAVRLEDDDGEISTDADNHQRHEHGVPTRQFCNQKHPRQRGMHHPRHHTRHAQQGEVLLRYIDTNLIDVPQSGEKESGKAANEQRGSKRTATTSATVCCRCSKHLCKQHQGNIGYQHRTLTREERIVQDAVPIGFRPPVQ